MKITVREAARLLSVSETEIYRWIDGGEIPCHVVHHQPLFSRAELLEWATSHRRPLSPELFEDGRAASSLAAAIERGGVHPGVRGEDRAAALRAVVERLPLPDPEERELVLAILLAHEREASTSVGDGIAIPHVRGPLVFAGAPAAIAVCYLDHPVPFEAIDGVPVHVVCAIMSPTIRAHLQLLSRLSLALLDPVLRDALAHHVALEDLLAHVRRVEVAVATPDEHQPRQHDGSAP